MQVWFTRTAPRRYRVDVERGSTPPLVMDPGPGYDPYLPHDLVHFLVERHWKLEHGVFGQLAAGGNARTFEFAEPPRDRRAARRQRRRSARRNSISGTDIARSEMLAGIVQTAWMVHTSRLPLPADSDSVLLAAGVEKSAVVELLEELDTIASQWHGLSIGESLTLTWP